MVFSIAGSVSVSRRAHPQSFSFPFGFAVNGQSFGYRNPKFIGTLVRRFPSFVNSYLGFFGCAPVNHKLAILKRGKRMVRGRSIVLASSFPDLIFQVSRRATIDAEFSFFDQ